MTQANGPITVFLPCRKGSERVPRKNIRPFGGFEHGLIEIKLGQLLACPSIDRIVLSTNDEEILDLARRRFAEDRLSLHRRVEELSSSQTSTDSLVAHARSLTAEGHILWTHVTSPFVGAGHYAKMIADYREALTRGYDSLMTATPLHAFLWSETAPINYDRAVEKWPRTQTLAPVYEVNSAAFLASCEVYDRDQDRIGRRPLIWPLDKITAMDIDWEEDFRIAEQTLLGGLAST